MKICITNGVRRILDLNIDMILRHFYSLEDRPDEQCGFIRDKLDEIALVDGIGRKNISLINRLKRTYLIGFRRMPLILFGLLRAAEDDAEAKRRAEEL